MADKKKEIKVVMSELIAVRCKNTPCSQSGCWFYEFDIGDRCDDVSFAMTNVNCNSGYIFKKTEKWEQCTRKNTNVNDIVRVYGAIDKAEHPRVIEHFYEKPLDGNHDVLVRSQNETFPVFLKHYEININR